MRHFFVISSLVFCCNTWSAEVTCLVANFKAALDTPAASREAAAHQWLKERAAGCSYEQLTAIKNNLGNWMGVANSYRVSVELENHLERYYVAKNEWSESLYTSKAAYVAPYTSRTLTAETNVIVTPQLMEPAQFGENYPQQVYGAGNSDQQQPTYEYQTPASGSYQNNYQPAPQEQYADPNSDW